MGETSNAGIHVAVLGGGPGGYAAAFHAADLGMKVTLIDADKDPGGVCLHRGCIPSKALLHVAKLISEAREAENWGVSFSPPKIDVGKLRQFKTGVVTKLTGGVSQLAKARGVKLVRGFGKFISSQSIEVTSIGENPSTTTITFDFGIIATGSQSAIPPAFAINDPRVMDSTGALELEDGVRFEAEARTTHTRAVRPGGGKEEYLEVAVEGATLLLRLDRLLAISALTEAALFGRIRLREEACSRASGTPPSHLGN